MDTKAVRTFVVLSETLNYQQAAQQLNYAPSTLTAHIRALEEELGTKLFSKVGRQLEITEEGRKFLSHARHLLSDYDQAMQSIARTQRELTLSVGSCELAANYACAPLFRFFSERHPGIRLSTHFSSNLQTPHMVLRGDVDVGLHYPPSQTVPLGLEGTFLFREPICVVAAADHPLAGRYQLHYGDLAGLPFSAPHADCSCTTELIRRLDEAEIPLGDVRYFGGLMQVVIDCLLSQGTLLACPYSAALQIAEVASIRILDLEEDPIWLRAGVFYTPAKRTMPAVAAFVNTARQFARDRLRQDPDHFLAP